MTAPGTNPYQRGPGDVDENTMRTVPGGGADSPYGNRTDAPAAPQPINTEDASIIALLKGILNREYNIDLSNTDIVMNTQDIEDKLTGKQGDYIPAIIDSTTTPNVVYVGQTLTVDAATSAAVWLITRIDSTTADTIIKNGGKDYAYDQVWDDRATTVVY